MNAFQSYIAELVHRFIEWVTKHFGEAIWWILGLGLFLILLGAVSTDLQEWRTQTDNQTGTVLDMFAERSFEEFINKQIIATLNPIGIEIVGAVFVAIGFLLLRDSNREKIDSLHQKIENLEKSQKTLLDMLSNTNSKLDGITNAKKENSKAKK